MATYTRQVDFTAKDSLASGSPGKIVKGVDFDSEFDEIKTVVDQKFDSANYGIDIVPLDTANIGAKLIDESYLPDASASAPGITEYASNAETLDGGVTDRAVRPQGLVNAFFGYTNNAVFDANLTANGNFTANGSVALALGAQVGGNDIFHEGNDGAGSGLDADLLDGSQGSFYQNAGNINAGTLADARLSGQVPLRSIENSWQAQQYFSVVAVTPVSTPSNTEFDFSLSNQFTITLDRDINFTTTGLRNGSTTIIRLLQDGTGGWAVNFPGGWRWPAGIVPTVTTDPSAVDLLTIVRQGSTIYATLTQDFS